MNLFKNYTIYQGKPFLRIEKDPYYTRGGRNGHILNKVLLNLKFFMIVTRVNKGFLDKEKVSLINNNTGGVIDEYRYREVFENGEYKRIVLNSKNKKEFFSFKREDIVNDFTSMSFLSQKGEYLGDAELGWWYYTNNLYVYDKFIKGVAYVLERNAYGLMKENIKGVYGFSHRGGSVFEIGDRLFESDYIPSKDDYTEKEWLKYSYKLKKLMNKAVKNNDKMLIDDIQRDGISYVMPFNRRGRIVISDIKQATMAAINLSEHLS